MLQHYDISAEGISRRIIVGVDEAGRGCMIGPVFAAAVVWDPKVDHGGINDSKKLSRVKRAALRIFIEEHAVSWGVGFATNEEIDMNNILNATHIAMHRALDDLALRSAQNLGEYIPHKTKPFDRILVDGDRFRLYKCYPHVCEKSADARFVPVAAASILAKEYHDEWITSNIDVDTVLKYDLQNNKGYGTKTHLSALKQHGMCPMHRRTFCSKYSKND